MLGTRQGNQRPARWFIPFHERESRDPLWCLLCTEPAYYREETTCNHAKDGTNYCCLRAKGAEKDTQKHRHERCPLWGVLGEEKFMLQNSLHSIMILHAIKGLQKSKTICLK